MSVPGNPFQAPQPTNPYGDGGYYGPPPKPDSGIPVWIWIVLALLAGGGVVTCGCCGGLVWFGLGIQADELKASLQGNPVIAEHIGEIEELSIDFGETIQEDGSDATVCRVKGSKGSGKIVGETMTNNDGNEVFRSGELRLPNGAKHDLFPHGNGH